MISAVKNKFHNFPHRVRLQPIELREEAAGKVLDFLQEHHSRPRHVLPSKDDILNVQNFHEVRLLKTKEVVGYGTFKGELQRSDG